jgi:hypothetical protein
MISKLAERDKWLEIQWLKKIVAKKFQLTSRSNIIVGVGQVVNAYCVLEQETLPSLLSTGWFQEQILECFNKLVDSNTFKLKYISINWTTCIRFFLHKITINPEALFEQIKSWLLWEKSKHAYNCSLLDDGTASVVGEFTMTMQRHWTCPRCNVSMVASIGERLEHEAMCHASNITGTICLLY